MRSIIQCMINNKLEIYNFLIQETCHQTCPYKYFERRTLDKVCTLCSNRSPNCLECLPHSGYCTKCKPGFILYSSDLKEFVSENHKVMDYQGKESAGILSDLRKLKCLDCFSVSGNCCKNGFGLNKVSALNINST